MKGGGVTRELEAKRKGYRQAIDGTRESEARVKTRCRRDERGEIPGEAKAQERNEHREPDNTGLMQRTWLVQQSSGPQLVDT